MGNAFTCHSKSWLKARIRTGPFLIFLNRDVFGVLLVEYDVAPRLDLDPNNRPLLLESGIGMLVLNPTYYDIPACSALGICSP